MDLRSWEPGALDLAGLDYRLLHPDDGSEIRQIGAMEEWLEGSIRERLNSGTICMVAMDGETVAGFNLVSYGRVRVPLIETDLTFGHNEAWSDQITVALSYRGRGIASNLRFKVFEELKERGIDRFYGGALALNVGSLKLARKVGFREIIDIRYRKILGAGTRSYSRLRVQ